jgi:DNA repair protein RAD51
VIITNEVVAQVDGSPMFAGPRSSSGNIMAHASTTRCANFCSEAEAEARFQVASEGVADVKD